MSKVLVTSDLHFFHGNVIQYENRPFRDIQDMNECLIENWNRSVSRCDHVFVLGDVSFGNKEDTKSVINQLKGRKILIMGNHDRGRSVNSFWHYVGFDEVSKYPIIYDKNIIMQHEPPSSEYFEDKDTPFKVLYGHVHLSEMFKTVTRNTVCVCTERWNFAPVELTKCLELMTSI